MDSPIDFPRGSSFRCLECDAPNAKAYDTQEEKWRHHNFFQYATYLHARVPRVRCPKECGIKTVKVPWSRPGSGFTLLFEALIMALAREMPVAAVAKLVGEHDTRLWRVIHQYVNVARTKLDFSEVRGGGRRDGQPEGPSLHQPVLRPGRAAASVSVPKGERGRTVRSFSEDLTTAHGGDPDGIHEVCCDMSPAFIAGVTEALPNAEITFAGFTS